MANTFLVTGGMGCFGGVDAVSLAETGSKSGEF